MPYWLWIGNQPQINSTPQTNVTDQELASVVGISAAGPNEISAVFMDGEIRLNNFQTTFNPNTTPTQMHYEMPDGTQVQGALIETFLNVSIRLYDLDAEGNQVVLGDFRGIFAQMSNGDMFFRPQSGFQDTWSGLDRIYSIEIVTAGRFNVTDAVNPRIGFNPDIVDLTVIPCFVRGTMIMTDRGNIKVEDLTAGDLVKTMDRGLQPIRWIGSRALSAAALSERGNLRPIRIRAGALGEGVPESDLLVSPQHRILIRSKIAVKMFGVAELLVAAKHLLQLDGVEIVEEGEGVEYFHILFEQHEIINSNGAMSESFLPGPLAMQGITSSALEEILTLFPELKDGGHLPEPARQTSTARMAKSMVSRHIKNNKPLCADLAQV